MLPQFSHAKPNAPIGVYDSGVGGLTVANGIVQQLKNEQLIYYGDTAHMPYGDKSDVAIRHYAHRVADFLLAQGCKAMVIACNTASAVACNSLQKYLHQRIPVVDVIVPVSEAVVAANLQKVGIIATPQTIKTGAYPKQLQQLQPNLQLVQKAAKSLAAIIEEGMYQSPAAIDAIIEYYLNDPNFDGVQGLVLACTHYPIIKTNIEAFFIRKKRQVQIFDSTHTVAKQVAHILQTYNLLNTSGKKPVHQFYVSDYTAAFEQTAQIFFGQNIHLQEMILHQATDII
ncbi:MAG: glutamate racemase [Sphingobacteriales bacterium]|jgi:glutamate racemase|nr:glutamate racemase [Sphingobacteriales bacterium]MBP9142723.1 glutamate racemase [Chitinophagales bacterium]MDA0199743.1 glutamate racemase [Bacteroidota bacterium]MBK6890274.1 glutamate racemase [Sphingobacteriales bacterium]MBK7527199.1 glutamate racemase [Sphingobacteriales bacterium]